MRIFGKISKGTQKNCLAIILYAIKEYFQKKHKKTVEPNDCSLSNDLFGIRKDTWG